MSNTIKWAELKPHEQKFFIKLGANLISQPIAYQIWHRVFKAPKWAAWGIVCILSGQSIDRAKAEYDFARALDQVAPEPPPKGDSVWDEFLRTQKN